MAEHLGIEIWSSRSKGDPIRVAIGRAVRQSLAGRLPERYATDGWRVPFDRRLDRYLQPGIAILDVGAGSLPVLPVDDRPARTTYVGLDIELDELQKAPTGSYDAMVASDVTQIEPSLEGRFDLVVSWLTMEHVESVPDALENLTRYLRPGGRFLGYLAGRNAASSQLNRLVPHRVAKLAMSQLLDREPDTVFPAHYDSCTFSELESVAPRDWIAHEIVPVFTGGWYFSFSPVVRSAYLAYEEWAVRTERRDLATTYIVDATKRGEPDPVARASRESG